MTNKDYAFNGLSEVEEALKTLPAKMQASLLKSFNRKASTKFVVKPLRMALNYSSRTKKAIKIASVRDDKTAVYAGPTSDAFYLRFLEKGTKERKGRGKITGKHKIERVADRGVNPIIKYTNKEFGEVINEFLLKKLKRARKQ